MTLPAPPTLPSSPPSIQPSTQATPINTSKAKLEEEQNLIKFQVLQDKSDVSMILMSGLKAIYQKQLPNMPKEYVARLVYDRSHMHMAVIKPPLKVVGGLTFRPFSHRNFSEIVFCAISSSEQVKGYGSRLMSHVKDFTRTLGIENFLTYADNFAIGYFKKQGFTTEITMDKVLWVGYIKDYEGGTLMQCTMIPKVVYLNAPEIIETQRKAVWDKIRASSNPTVVYKGLSEDLFPIPLEKLDSIPGFVENGWSASMMPLITKSPAKNHSPLYTSFKVVVEEMRNNPNSWPFVEPVSGVADYYDIIKEPMDISTLGSNVENDEYATVEDFVKDATKIFQNCRIYNEEGTNYVKCANKLERWFQNRIKVLRAELVYL